MTIRLIAVFVVAFSTAMACAASPRQRPISAGPAATGPGTVTAARKFLEGRWVLSDLLRAAD